MDERYYEWPRADQKGLVRYLQPQDLPAEFQLSNVSRLAVLQNKGPIGVAEQLYTLICKRGIKYDGPPANTNSKTQRIRKPTTISENKRGTCLDLAALFATMCLAEGLLPLLIVVDSHALVGLSLTQTSEDRQKGKKSLIAGGMLAESNFSILQELAAPKENDQKEYLFIECTGAAYDESLSDTFPEGRKRENGLMSFERACEAGYEQILQHIRLNTEAVVPNKRVFLYALDVYDLQVNHGIAPIKGNHENVVIQSQTEVDARDSQGFINQPSGPVTQNNVNTQSGDAITGNKIIIYNPPATPALHLADEPPIPGNPPFKGLQYFDASDANIFFGRELLTAKLTGKLREQRFLAIVGASGSGKSSLVRAGLVPALKQGETLADDTLPPEGSIRWPLHVITPTARPLEALAASLTRDSESLTATTTLMDDLARDPRSLHLAVRRVLGREGGERLLIVVDQFEELFTLCRSDTERLAFVDNLLIATAPETEGPSIVVITLRADFYSHCLQYADLREVLEKQQVLIGPMSADELRRAIEEPATRGDWNFEEGLVDLLLREVGNEPGALPLLSHALLETWKRRSGRTLTLKGYAESGGVRGAIAKTAETVYRQFSPEQQTIARNIFLRLTELGEGTQDTRRRTALTELTSRLEEKAAVEAVIKTLADARLITTEAETAEVAHEALIREWPTLRLWLDKDRAGLQIHRHLTEAAQAWVESRRDPGELYRGGRLSAAREWAEEHGNELNALEQEFLAASQALQLNELETAQKRVAQLRRRSFFLAWTLGIAAVFLLAALGATGLAFQQAGVALSRQLAAQAQSSLSDNPQRSILLALEARRFWHTDEAEEVLARAPYVYPPLWATLQGHTDRVWSVAWSPDGKQLASASDDKTIIVWDVASGQPLTILKGHTSYVQSVAWSPDGRQLASGSDDKTIILWDVASGQLLKTLTGHTGGVWSVAWSPDGKQLASGSDDSTIILWDVASGQLLKTLTGHMGSVRSVAWSPDGKQLASGSEDAHIILWDVASSQPLTPTLEGHTDSLRSVAWSPDGKQLASGSADNTIILWDVANGQRLTILKGHTNFVESVVWSPDGRQLASGSLDNTIILWDVASRQPLTTLKGHTKSVLGVAWSPDGQQLASGSLDNTIILWDVASGQTLTPLKGHTQQVRSVAWSPDSRQLASGSDDTTIILWDVASGQPLTTLTGHTNTVVSVVWSPDGRQLASGSWDNTIILWDVASGQPLTPTLEGHTSGVWSVAWSPDGKQLASASDDKTIIVWDVASGQRLKTLTGHTGGVRSVAWSPDGRQLASGSEDASIIVWDVASGQPLTTLTGHTGGVWRVAWSPDGRQLASGSDDTTIIVWDVASGQALTTLMRHTSNVLSVAWSPDGRQLASGSADTTIALLKTRFIRPPCELVSRDLMRDEWKQYMPWYIPYHPTCPK